MKIKFENPYENLPLTKLLEKARNLWKIAERKHEKPLTMEDYLEWKKQQSIG